MRCGWPVGPPRMPAVSPARPARWSGDACNRVGAMPVEASESAVLLFTDIVGSTRLMTGMPPDRLRRHAGSTSPSSAKPCEHGGEEIKNLGDGIMVLFTSAARAIACAVAMQQGTERANRTSPHTIGLHAGLSGGDVVRDDGDCFGDPVVEASRLCAKCTGGQILAAEIVRIMAGRRCRHECRSVGPLNLKGLPEPVPTIEVLWEPLAHVRRGTGASTPDAGTQLDCADRRTRGGAGPACRRASSDDRRQESPPGLDLR